MIKITHQIGILALFAFTLMLPATGLGFDLTCTIWTCDKTCPLVFCLDENNTQLGTVHPEPAGYSSCSTDKKGAQNDGSFVCGNLDACIEKYGEVAKRATSSGSEKPTCSNTGNGCRPCAGVESQDPAFFIPDLF
ncbi:MAG: hypothetical protein KDD53_01610 [Bdellovibrionales bacterium]|nr:hypothetical protein [Bdellovibrionales bacterium]